MRIQNLDKKKLFIGLLLVGLSLCMPLLLTVHNIGIYTILAKAATEQDIMFLLIAASLLVMLNSLRCFPHYLGAFFIADAINLTIGDKPRKLLKAGIVCLIIPTVYILVDCFYGIKYDFGIPAFILITLLTFLGRADYYFVSFTKRVFMVMTFIMAFQFLDILPGLSGLPIGRGETSRDLKMYSKLMDADRFLELFALLCMIALLAMGVLLLFLLREENNIKAINKLKEENEAIIIETRMRDLENRTYMEMQHLVHDLKSPLTSVQALVGVIKLKSAQAKRIRECEYLERIESSIERMSTMISEILHENHRTPITTEIIIDTVMSQISISEYTSMVQTDNAAPALIVSVNKIRLSRAIVNLIENSFYAVDKVSGKIHLAVDAVDSPDGKFARFTVSDNGSGIPATEQTAIWETGYSTRSSHGLGLNFVRSVVERCNGSVTIQSDVGSGTEVTILIPVGGSENE